MEPWSPPKHDPIREHTSARSNARIDRETRGAIHEVVAFPSQIRQRLSELEREWTVDRALMLNFAVLGALSASLAMRNLRTKGRLGGWGALFVTQLGFLAYHAIWRWCLPLPVFRRLGFRTDKEIGAERKALENELES